VVDVGALAPRPVHVVQDVEAVRPQKLELCTDGALTGQAAVPHLGCPIHLVRLFGQVRACA